MACERGEVELAAPDFQLLAGSPPTCAVLPSTHFLTYSHPLSHFHTLRKVKVTHAIVAILARH